MNQRMNPSYDRSDNLKHKNEAMMNESSQYYASNQSCKQSIKQTTGQASKLSIKQSIRQSCNQSSNQSSKQASNRAIVLPNNLKDIEVT